ncbi:MAG: TraR/DksA C4-type zinc finger protein [Acidobacteria bacterium]|nr:TraR/DksA C4-type zinc finger protein [Acidobacteriota bacterium]
MSPHLDREGALKAAYQSLADEELFSFATPTIRFSPEEIPGYWAPRVICEDCGEGVGLGKHLARNGRVLCRCCASARDLEPSAHYANPSDHPSVNQSPAI